MYILMSLVKEDYREQIKNSFIQYLKQSKRTENCRIISNFQRVIDDRSIYIGYRESNKNT
jgi:hypothetical protein